MKKSIFVLSCFLTVSSLFAQEVKPLYQLPAKVSPLATDSETDADIFLVGSDEGLFKVTSRNTAFPLWKEGRVDQLIQARLPVSNDIDEKYVYENCWIMRTSKGIFFTSDLKKFEERDNGLPFLTIKKYENKSSRLEKQIQELKDLNVNPLNNEEMVTATKDSVFYSKDGGLSWKSIGSTSRNTPGVKACAVATIDGETVVFMAHPIFGLSYIFPNREKTRCISFPRRNASRSLSFIWSVPGSRFLLSS